MLLIIIVIAVLVLTFTAVYFRKKSGSSTSQTIQEPYDVISEPEDKSRLKNISEFISEKDPGFSVAVFTEKISNLYIRLCNSIEDKNTLMVKPYFTGDILASFDGEIAEDERNGLTHVYDKLTVLSSSVSGWKSDGDNDVIIAEIRSRMTDYKINSEGKTVTSGTDTEKFITVEWTLEREASKETGDSFSLSAQNCPNCGATVNINNSSVCEYCGCVLNTDSFDWIVTGIKLISREEVNI
jgi:predicted lipid-binding transport protein (Tim44 family)